MKLTRTGARGGARVGVRDIVAIGVKVLLSLVKAPGTALVSLSSLVSEEF